jgi:transposase-like protein
VLVELGLVEQRYRAVCEVLDGASVVDVARRNGVARQTVHDWLRAYANHGMAGLADRSSKPQSCPHQMAPTVEARIVEHSRLSPANGDLADAWPPTRWQLERRMQRLPLRFHPVPAVPVASR